MSKARLAGASIYEHGNLQISGGRLRIDRQSLPLTNIVSVTDRRVHRPRKHSTATLIVAAAAIVVGYRLLPFRLAWAIMAVGTILGAWCLIFWRDKVRIINLNLLLNQRIKILFPDPMDADGFLEALTIAKGGKLPIIRR